MNRTANSPGKKIRSLGLAMAILLAAVTLTAGGASAHTCRSYEGCDAKACKDGEDHDHTDMNYVARDEHCHSTARPRGPEDCYVADRQVPKIVCEIVKPTKPELPKAERPCSRVDLSQDDVGGGFPSRTGDVDPELC